jgi:hypothetical protein
MRFLVFILTSVVGLAAQASVSPDIWIWPGAYRAQVDAVIDRSVFVLQRHVDKDHRYSARGPSPSPWRVRDLTLVFRLQARPAARQVLREFQQLRLQWEKHGVRVAGLQLDYDSPTNKLDQYRQDLNELTKILQSEAPELRLSITGLTDWTQLENFGMNKNIQVYFQLYKGSKEHSESEMNLNRLARADFPFKIGLLPKQTLRPDQLSLLNRNPNFRGFAEFYGGPRS